MLILLFQPSCIAGGADDSSAYLKAKVRLLHTLQAKQFDRAFTQSIHHFYMFSCDSLVKKKVTIDNRPVRDILTRFFEICDSKLNTRAINALRIPSLNSDFLLTLKTYKRTSIRNVYMGLNISKTHILQAVFDGLLLGDSIKTFMGLRDMLFDPYYISSRIHLAEYAAYTDTLLYLMANGAPDILVNKLAASDTFYTKLVNRSSSKTVKAIARLKPGVFFEETLPFGMALMENRISTEKIRQLLLVPKDYFHAFAEETIRLHLDKDAEINAFLKQTLTGLNKKFANHYFIKSINDLHELPDNIRFECVNTLPAIDLYFILLAGNNELVLGGSAALYTSSFLYVYKKFLQETEKEGLTAFFDNINYYRFDQFLSNISEYALEDNLVDNLKDEKVAILLWNYIAGLPGRNLTDNEIILNSMTMAEVLVAIRHHDVIRNMLIDKMYDLQKQSREPMSLMYEHMYDGLKEILLDEKAYTSDDSFDVLPVKRLQRDNNIVQVCYYYDDDDASCSFNNSTAFYNTKIWDKKDLGNYIVFISKTGNRMMIYMNKPNSGQGCDSSQDEMLNDIAKQGYEVTSFIHRGHSYHLPQSLRKMTAAAQFVFLGSCGGYSQVLKLFDLNPDVHIITSRGVGSMIINDPLLESINLELVNNNDINWNTLWQEFDNKFQSKTEHELFTSYIAPNKYIGARFIRRVYNY
jgi:hypothetical protein